MEITLPCILLVDMSHEIETTNCSLRVLVFPSPSPWVSSPVEACCCYQETSRHLQEKQTTNSFWQRFFVNNVQDPLGTHPDNWEQQLNRKPLQEYRMWTSLCSRQNTRHCSRYCKCNLIVLSRQCLALEKGHTCHKAFQKIKEISVVHLQNIFDLTTHQNLHSSRRLQTKLIEMIMKTLIFSLRAGSYVQNAICNDSKILPDKNPSFATRVQIAVHTDKRTSTTRDPIIYSQRRILRESVSEVSPL